MMKNSQSRITKRRHVALGNRLVNLKDAKAGTGQYAAYSEENRAVKLGLINTDIENLNKKGVRAA
jgi:hypothetical protein